MNTASGDCVWEHGHDRLIISPASGGRVVSWVHRGTERVHPRVLLEGGLTRVLFAEEQYPGSSYATPHEVVKWKPTEAGFELCLRQFWNTPNAFVKAFGWREKANELHLDGLWLDKVLRFDASTSCLSVEVIITNTTDHTKYLTPWLHSSFTPWPAELFMVENGERRPYLDTDIYWGCHVVSPGSTVRMVQSEAADAKSGTPALSVVTGVATDHLAGLCGMMPIAGEFLQATSELRFRTLDLHAGMRWRCVSFLMFTDDWQKWGTRSPIELVSVIEPAPVEQPPDPVSPARLRLLDGWAMEEEKTRGVMVMSFLDKPPFSGMDRYGAVNGFAGFHADANGHASATVAVYATRDIAQLKATLDAPPGWSLRHEHEKGRVITRRLGHGEVALLHLEAPSSLEGRERVRVRVEGDIASPLMLDVSAGAGVGRAYDYAVRQIPAYLEGRWRERTECPLHGGRAEFVRWQERMHTLHERWLEYNATDPCDPEPRLVERQIGPTCVREKWLFQVEPGQWMPGYLVQPKRMAGRRPLVFFLHGSGPGKQQFTGDEEPAFQPTQLGHELEYMPYRVALALNCSVYVPDARGCGEQGESHPANYPARLQAMGISYGALRVLDLPRILDGLLLRDDIDSSKVGSMGCSGGGGTTRAFAAIDRRIAACVISSTSTVLPAEPEPGYFHRMFVPPSQNLYPDKWTPIAPAHMAMMIAPRPLWITDGLDDGGIPPEKRRAWRETVQHSWDQIRLAYRVMDAESNFRETWFEGGHCGGNTVANMVDWFREWFGK